MGQQTLADGWLDGLMKWCSDIVGPCQLVSDDERFHGRSGVYRLQTSSKFYYLKVHQKCSSWEREVHGYENWSAVFGAWVPELIAIHPGEPWALLISELPGQIMGKVPLSREHEQQVWYVAGRELGKLHDFTTGEYFGPSKRDGSPLGPHAREACEYVSTEFQRLIDIGLKGGYLTDGELEVVQKTLDQVSVFEGEKPVPCHRDYGPDNWLVTEKGIWSGVIDFEFSSWDLRVVDFARYPNWEWIHRPDLLDAFFDGYGRPLTSVEALQCLILRSQYALGAIVWGHENEFYGFEKEGREALRYMACLI